MSNIMLSANPWLELGPFEGHPDLSLCSVASSLMSIENTSSAWDAHVSDASSASG